MGFSRQEYWRGLPFPSPEDLPDPGIEPVSPAWQVDSLLLSHNNKTQQPSEQHAERSCLLLENALLALALFNSVNEIL